jgi:hypothetical protein
LKEPVNNDSGLTHADIQDSLRQLESVKYKYTDEAQQTNPNSTDNDTHVGSVTQSYEKTPLFESAVVKDENGIGHMDLYKLNEALAAGLAEMQREIDSLTAPTSDANMKTSPCGKIETAIENNPVGAATALPEGSPLQKEAEQAVNGGNDTEVNNEAFNPNLTSDSILEEYYDKYNKMSNDDISNAYRNANLGGYRYKDPDEVMWDRVHRGMPYSLAENDANKDYRYAALKGIEKHNKSNKKWDAASPFAAATSLSDEFLETLKDFDRNDVIPFLKQYAPDYNWDAKFEGLDQVQNIKEMYDDLDLDTMEAILKDRKYNKDAKKELLTKMGFDRRFEGGYKLKPTEAIRQIGNRRKFEEALNNANDIDAIRAMRDKDILDGEPAWLGRKESVNDKFYDIMENTPADKLTDADVEDYIKRSKKGEERSIDDLYNMFGDKFISQIYHSVDNDKLVPALLSRDGWEKQLIDAFKEFRPDLAEKFSREVEEWQKEEDEHKNDKYVHFNSHKDPYGLVKQYLNDYMTDFDEFRKQREDSIDNQNIEKLREYFKNKVTSLDEDDPDYFTSDENLKTTYRRKIMGR